MIKITGQETGKVYYINPEKIASIETTDTGSRVVMDNTVEAPKVYDVSESARVLSLKITKIKKPSKNLDFLQEPTNA